MGNSEIGRKFPSKLKQSPLVNIKPNFMRQVLTLLLLLVSFHLFADESNYSIDTIQINSDVLGENRKAIIYKPSNIDKVDSVKFLYLLDGDYSNHLYEEIETQFGESISDMIVIGIINQERRRDMLYINEAKKFLEFLTTELIPNVEKNFKTKTRILNGHSFCGSFTIFSMLEKPEYFDCFIAASPTPIMDLVEYDSYLQIDKTSKKKMLFYFSYGSKDMKQVKKWSNKLKENLSEHEFVNIDWEFEIFEGKRHQNSDVIALVQGLRRLRL